MTDENKPTYFKQSEDDFIPINVPDTAPPVVLSENSRTQLDAWLKRYPADQKRSGIYEALRLVQEEQGGWLTVPYMDAIADYLSLPKIAVYEVAAFYTMYYLNPVGQHIINVCTNISCALNGAEHLVHHIKERYGIGLNETTPDGRFTLKEVECLGACIAPPVCLINKQYHENMTPEKLEQILTALKSGGKHE